MEEQPKYQVAQIFTNGKLSRKIIKIDGSWITYENENGKINQCWITTFQDWVKRAEKQSKPSYDQLKAENQRLKEALKEIQEAYIRYNEYGESNYWLANKFSEIYAKQLLQLLNGGE